MILPWGTPVTYLTRGEAIIEKPVMPGSVEKIKQTLIKGTEGIFFKQCE